MLAVPEQRLPFSSTEFEARLARVQEQMAVKQFDALLLHQPEAIYYVSGLAMRGFFEYHALLVPASGEPTFIIREMERPAVLESSWLRQIESYDDAEPDQLAAAERAVRKEGLDRGVLAVDSYSWFLTAERERRLRRHLPSARFVDEAHLVDHLRMIKTPREIECVREACRVVEAGVEAGMGAASAGASEREVAAAIVEALVLAGHDDTIAGAVTSGDRAELLHSNWSDRVIGAGEVVRLELSGVSRGYTARLMRAGAVGAPMAEQTRVADILRRAQDEAIRRMAPGVPAVEIDRAAREPVVSAGLRDRYTNRVGYGLGIIFRPSGGEFLREFVPGASWTLEAGMVFHMLVQAQGIGFSETVCVTETGHEVLTRFPRELLSLPYGGLG